MVKWFNILGLAVLSGVVPLAAPALAATSATLDILPDDAVGKAADTVELGSVRPIARPGREGAQPLPSGNPLWAVPLSVLNATQARPIFSASRRPPPQAVVAPAAEQASAPPPQRPAEPEHPPLALLGSVVGESDAIAVFLDRTNQKIVRLHQGETHGGWLLSSVARREVTLRKADRTEVLALQRPDGAPGASPAGPAMPGLLMPAAGSTDASYAPFVPRSTPKNGESDGL